MRHIERSWALSNAASTSLRRLRDADLVAINYVEDIRGHRVVDRNGDPVGSVDMLFVDGRERKIRFFRVEPDPSFETADGIVLIPVDAIMQIARCMVHIDRPRGQLAIAPRDLALLATEADIEMLYRYYGFKPFWSAGYIYPPYPFYA